MNLTVKDHAGYTLVRVDGDVGHGDVRLFMATLDGLVDRDVRRVVLDLGAVPYVTSRGLGAIVGTFAVLTRRGGGLVVVTEQPEVLGLLAMTKLDAIVPIVPTVDEALERLPPPPTTARMA